MPQESVTRCLGLVLQYNPLEVAPGALIRADDCVIDRENIVEDRRGYASYFALSSTGSQLLVYSSKVLAHNGTTITYDNGGTAANYSGTYSAPSGRKMRSVEAFQNLYLTTSKGVQVITDTAGTAARLAGAPRPLDITSTLVASGSGFLNNNIQVAYRSVVKRTDANSNVIFSYPSNRTIVSNTSGGAANVTLKCYLPTEVTTGDLLQVYRTKSVTASGSANDPGEEMALVYQINPTGTDLTNGYVSFTDLLIDALQGASLYTSPSQLGIVGANDRPPICKDIALYKNNYLVMANTSTKQRLSFALVSSASLSGKTLTLAGTTYTFGASENAATGQVLADTSGVTAANIESTARSLVRVINQYATNTSVYAYYQSGPQDPPGKILIEERGIGASTFTLSVSDATAATQFSPAPPVSPATSTLCTSSNQVQKNAISFSQYQQPEAVPVLNSVIAGPANKEILRIAPLRNSLIIIKEEGVYRMTGDSPQNFSVVPLDLTVFCKAPDSVAVLANTVIMLSNQGVVQITETGVQVISREIEPAIKPLPSFSSIGTLAFAVGYESDRAYLLSVPTSSSDSAPNQVFRFNIFTKAWSRFSFGFSCAAIEPTSDRLYFCKPADTKLYQERKSFSDADYADPESTVTITALNAVAKTLSITSPSAIPDAGWVLSQNGVNVLVASVSQSGSTYVLTMQSPLPDVWTTGSATLYPSVGYNVVWDAWVGEGGASALKQISEAAILSDNIPGYDTTTGVSPSFYTNLDQSSEEVTITLSGGRWGDAWGSFPWGAINDTFAFRTYVPRNKQMCRTMNVGVRHRNALEKFACAGYSLTYRPLGERIGR